MNALGDAIADNIPAIIAFLGTLTLFWQNRRQVNVTRETDRERNSIRATEIASEREQRRLDFEKEDWERRARIYSEFLSQAARTIFVARSAISAYGSGDVEGDVLDDLSAAGAQVTLSGNAELRGEATIVVGDLRNLLDVMRGEKDESTGWGSPQQILGTMEGHLGRFEDIAARDLESTRPALSGVLDAESYLPTASGPTRRRILGRPRPSQPSEPREQ